jgi:hypothetical protein
MEYEELVEEYEISKAFLSEAITDNYSKWIIYYKAELLKIEGEMRPFKLKLILSWFTTKDFH